MKTGTCRTASITDATEIARLINLAYRPESSLTGWTHESDLVNGNRTSFEQISTLLLKPNSVILVASRNNLIVACIHLEKSGMDCHIGLFAVSTIWQGAGIGKQLLAQAEKYAAEHFCSERFVMTVVSVRPELISFYLRRGYRRTGQIMDYPLSAGVGTPIQNGLKTEILEKYSEELMKIQNIPVSVMAAEIPPRAKLSIYPEPFASRMVGREKRILGDFFGLSNFGVNLTKLASGASSALRHSHSKQDEFIYILQGSATLISDAGETELLSGMCAGFKAGTGIAHQLVNRTHEEVLYLEVGDRSSGDFVQYPDDDLQATLVDEQWKFTHKDGTPY